MGFYALRWEEEGRANNGQMKMVNVLVSKVHCNLHV